MRAAWQWASERSEYIVLGLSLAVIGTLVAWWSVFARRMIDALYATSAEVAQLRGSVEGVAEAQARADRLAMMIRGESAMFALALVASVTVLFLLVRRHREARERMQRLLQFTSHELKTPIAGVRALLQTLQKNRVPQEMRAVLFDDGLAACDRLEHLTETILAYQRAVAASGQVAVNRTDTLVDAVIAHRRRTTHGESIDIAPVDVAWVSADADAFRVVLENLLDNARKYGGGHTQVRTVAALDAWILRVIDDGRGFSEDESERLFEPFARANGESEKVTHGSGLGLYLSRQLARRMGGDLTAASSGVGFGSVFTLTLARVPAPLHEEVARVG